MTSIPTGARRIPAPLVSAQQLLAARASGLEPVIVDCSFDLADTGAGERAFAQAHLPGARYAHLDRGLWPAPRRAATGRHPLPARAAWAATPRVSSASSALATPGRRLRRAGQRWYAARAWWMLRWVGHGPVRAILRRGPCRLEGREAAASSETGPLAARGRRRAPIRSPTASCRSSTPRRCVARSDASRSSMRVQASAFAARSNLSMRARGIFPERGHASSRTTSTPPLASAPRRNCTRRSPRSAPRRNRWCINAARASRPATTSWPWRSPD